MSGLRVEIFRGSNPGRREPWYVRVVAGNGETLAVSEGYYSRWNAKRAARRLLPGVEIVELESVIGHRVRSYLDGRRDAGSGS